MVGCLAFVTIPNPICEKVEIVFADCVTIENTILQTEIDVNGQQKWAEMDRNGLEFQSKYFEL